MRNGLKVYNCLLIIPVSSFKFFILAVNNLIDDGTVESLSTQTDYDHLITSDLDEALITLSDFWKHAPTDSLYIAFFTKKYKSLNLPEVRDLRAFLNCKSLSESLKSS